jgi:hypothetical protein
MGKFSKEDTILIEKLLIEKRGGGTRKMLNGFSRNVLSNSLSDFTVSLIFKVYKYKLIARHCLKISHFAMQSGYILKRIILHASGWLFIQLSNNEKMLKSIRN